MMLLRRGDGHVRARSLMRHHIVLLVRELTLLSGVLLDPLILVHTVGDVRLLLVLLL